MNIGILTPGFSADAQDYAIPFLDNFVRELALTDDVRVIALRYPHQRQPYRLHGAQVYPLGVGAGARGARRLAIWIEALRLIMRLHRERPFDVLHAIWSDETGLLAAWGGRWLRVPVVTTVTGGELVGFPDIDYGSQCSRWGHWIVGQAMRADAVVVSGSHNRALIGEARYRVADAKIRTIVWGVDTRLFTPLAVPRLPRRLLHVGSLIGIKNQVRLLRVLAHLQADVTLDIVGEGPLLPDLERLALELGVAGRVSFVGAVPHAHMPDYYRRAALLVMTSRNEGVPLTAIEAAACGLPTVSTHVGVLPDYPAMGVTVPGDDDVVLASAISELLEDGTHRAALSQSAAATAHARFSIQQTAAQYHALYAGLCQ